MSSDVGEKKSIADRIVKIIEYSGENTRRFCMKIDVSTGYIHSLLKKKDSSVGSNVLCKILERFPDLSPAWLLTGAGPMLREGAEVSTDQKVEGASSLSAGVPFFDLYGQGGFSLADAARRSQVGSFSLPGFPLADGAVKVYGDAMSPLLEPDDIVLYRVVSDPGNLTWGSVYLVEIDGSEEAAVSIRYVHQGLSEGFLRLASHNALYRDREVAVGRVRAMALALALIRRRSLS